MQAFVRFLVKPLVEHDSIKTQKINRARERRVMKQMAEKYGPIVYKRFKNGRLFCIGCGAPIQTENKRGLGYSQSKALEKGLKQAKFIANAVSVCVTTMKWVSQ